MTSCRELLDGMAGTWRGTYRLWLEPDVLHSESETLATVTPALGGRFALYRYSWAESAGAQEGEMLIGSPDGAALQAAWIDSWHNGDSIMFCRPAGGAAVIGEYGPADEPWRWRTAIEMPAPDQLRFTAWNIAPNGDEAKATEAVYERVG